jgi:CBS domain-containing protein
MDTLADALLLMHKSSKGALPVVDRDGKLEGIITRRDLISAFIHVLGIEEPGTFLGVVVEEKLGQMKKIVDAKADVIIGTGTTSMAAAAIRAEQLHGVLIPTIASPHHTIWPLAVAMKSFKPWEGHYVVAGQISVTEKDSRPMNFIKFMGQGICTVSKKVSMEVPENISLCTSYRTL